MKTQVLGEGVDFVIQAAFDAIGYIVPDRFEDVGVGVCRGSCVEDVCANARCVESDDCVFLGVL